MWYKNKHYSLVLTMLSNAIIRTGESSSSSSVMNIKEKEKYIEEFDFPFCDESTKYEKVAKIGQGTFGYIRF